MNSIKVLIVEDEPVIAINLKVVIKKIGCELSGTASSGNEAILLAMNNSPDLILMDICLVGEINGLEAMREIRKNNNIPVIFITGYQDNEMIELSKEFNPLAYLIKPININELIDCIKTNFNI